MALKDNINDAKEAVVERVENAVDCASEIEFFQNPPKLQIPKGTGVLDMLQEKLISRKLLVFATATALMWYGLDSDTWGMIAMCYIGGQSAIDFAKVWRG